MYKELARLHRDEALDFSRVVTFNLDEYLGLAPSHAESFHYFMPVSYTHLFSNRDLRREALRIFDRTFAITYALEAVAVLVAVMGVAGALLALVIDRRRELGLLRFLGAASGQVRKLIVVEAGLLGLLATLAGVALGFALSLICLLYTSIVASALGIPALVYVTTRFSSQLLGTIFGVEALLASRSLSGSLRRTSVLVGALSTAIAMMTAVGIMVGSFRETVLRWMGDQLPADLYMRPAGDAAADRHPTITPELADAIAALPGVAAIDRLREYEISYDGMPAGLGSVELRVLRSYHKEDFLSGRPTNDVLAELRNANAVIVSEPFANKHHLKRCLLYTSRCV